MQKFKHEIYSHTKVYRHRIVYGGVCGQFVGYNTPAILRIPNVGLAVAVTNSCNSEFFPDPNKIYIVKEYE